MSQATPIGAGPEQSWNDLEHNCCVTYGGGYQSDRDREIFHHGIRTVFRLLGHELPSLAQCKAAPDLLAALVKMRRTMYSDDSEESKLADAAIAKATGE